jgi:hypothetical protein
VIRDELGRLRNPVLNRRMFTTPQQRAAMARGPVGINASGPELIKATSTTGNPFIDQGLVNRRKVSTMSNTAPIGSRGGGQYLPGLTIPENEGMPDTKPQTPPLGEFEGVGPQTDPGLTPPSSRGGGLDDVPPSFQQPKEKKDSGDEDGKTKEPSAKSAMDDILDRISGMRGTEDQDKKKTRKEKFQEAKDFLAEAGVTQAKDVRTDRDFLMMLGGLKFAMGSGTGSMSQDAVAALSSVLGTFASGKQEERQLEQKLNMAAAERVLAQEDTAAATAAARELAMDKLAVTAQLKKAELEQDPKLIREVRAIMDEAGVSFTEALKLQQATSTKKPGFQETGMLALMGPPYNLSAADAFLIANNSDIMGDVLEEGPEAVKDALAALKGIGTQDSNNNGNSGTIDLTGNEDAVS